MPWESTISTYGLNKILQVSYHRCKPIKIAPKHVWTFIVRENKLCMILWWWSNKSDRLHNKGRYHKGQYKVTFLYIKSLHIQKQKAHDNLCFPLQRAYLLLYVFTSMQESIVFFSISFLLSLLANIVWWGLIHAYISSWIYVIMSYYCWHYPWGKYVGRQNYKPLYFYVFDWNFCSISMMWVSAIIED